MALGLFFFVLSPLWGPLPIGFRATSEMVFEGEILPFLCFGYLVICFISLVYWLKGKRVWRYSILGLGLIHFVGSSYLLDSVTDIPLFAFFLSGSFFVNLFLYAFILFGNPKSETLVPNDPT